MELIDQHTKKIMEGCKDRAREAGLRFYNETLEYIVTNRDLLKLTPKGMIPTMFDYWVQDVEVLREAGRYELYPTNPFETVINTRPAISFYNDNNPDWLNVMIFYHVLAHIDFFQNNIFFKHTWEFDFTGEALADKRMIARLRSEKGRWLDYVIEFSRGIDNLVGYYQELSLLDRQKKEKWQLKVDYYFDVFLQKELKAHVRDYLKEIDAYNELIREKDHKQGAQDFFARVSRTHPDFDEKFKKFKEKGGDGVRPDLLRFIMDSSDFLNKSGNRWMKSVMEVVRKTSLFFQPQMRTKIMNEGWATFWHEELFLRDERIKGHEIDFSRVHSRVASLSRVGMNPYALGTRLFQYIREMADRGRLDLEFEKILNIEQRNAFDHKQGTGLAGIYKIRETMSDSLFLKQFVTQDFVDRFDLFVAGKRLNRGKRSWEYYVKSRKAEDFRRMLLDSLYHPPAMNYALDKNGNLKLTHQFEGRPLVKDFIKNTMLGIEYLWGGPVKLKTHEVRHVDKKDNSSQKQVHWEEVVYTMKDRSLSRVTTGEAWKTRI
ncbi:MAG: SpoVR family protein [Desulfohalobiaceae bacterium]|nr:SpoVR family protein [Desulfohalobiaceae bacterium]